VEEETKEKEQAEVTERSQIKKAQAEEKDKRGSRAEKSNAHGRKPVLKRQLGQMQRRLYLSKKKRGSANIKERTCR
jgi:hypothetical protein